MKGILRCSYEIFFLFFISFWCVRFVFVFFFFLMEEYLKSIYVLFDNGLSLKINSLNVYSFFFMVWYGSRPEYPCEDKRGGYLLFSTIHKQMITIVIVVGFSFFFFVFFFFFFFFFKYINSNIKEHPFNKSTI